MMEVRMQITLDENLDQRVEDWRRRQPKIPARTEAVRMLMRLGLDAESIKAPVDAGV
jgi:hypothetical protein